MAKGHTEQKKQRPAVSVAANITPLSTKEGENTSEVLLQLFDPTGKTYSNPTGQFPVQSDRSNNYILVVYHYDFNNIFNTTLNNRTRPYFILNGITKNHEK